MSLKESFDKYEKEMVMEINKITAENHRQALKIEKQKRYIFLLIGITIFLILSIIGFAMIKLKFLK